MEYKRHDLVQPVEGVSSRIGLGDIPGGAGDPNGRAGDPGQTGTSQPGGYTQP